MPFHELGSTAEALIWLAGHQVRALRCDSRQIQAGDAFVAWPGYGVDARRYVLDALEAGALACLIEREGAEAFEGAHHPKVATLRGLKALTGPLASAFWSHPSHALKLMAVTGTNGKTSTSWWLAQALNFLGMQCGVVGTLGIGQVPDKLISHGLTTPDPVTLQAALRQFCDQGLVACAMEASSIGLNEHRLDGTQIEVALLTNFTQDHLDYHQDMDRYWAAKARLFAWPDLKSVVLNLDDPKGAILAPQIDSLGLKLWTYARHQVARLQAIECPPDEASRPGLRFRVQEAQGESVMVSTSLIGDYNISNLLAVMGGLRAMGVSLHEAAMACSHLTPVPGRMERVQIHSNAGGGPEVVVDYAHTPDALQKALQALRPLAQARGGKIWCVFGCGGNRDASKRAIMGALAEQWADQVVVTSDNPRDEPPQHIIRQILTGMSCPPRTIEDRAEAIIYAVTQARHQDLILLAGKGHENHQEVAGVKLPFSDVAHARTALALRKNAT
jgi:UDP-N-acetylmuramyl-tripeptide synthetase